MDYIFHVKDITDSTKRPSIMSFIKDAFKSQDLGLPWWLRGKGSACHCRRHRKTPHASGRLSPCTTTSEPVLRVREPQLRNHLCNADADAPPCTARAPQDRPPPREAHTGQQSAAPPPRCNRRKAPQQPRASTAKNKQTNEII